MVVYAQAQYLDLAYGTSAQNSRFSQFEPAAAQRRDAMAEALWSALPTEKTNTKNRQPTNTTTTKEKKNNQKTEQG